MNKKEIPLSGDALSTGVKLDRADASQIYREMGRIIKYSAIRCSVAANSGKKPEEDAKYNKAKGREHELSLLAESRFDALDDEFNQALANL
jgi:hypothetical protein